MWKLVWVPLLVFAAQGTQAIAGCDDFEGASVVSDDGQYLGKITSTYDSDSIYNTYGTHGSSYQTKSIWNTYGKYGSQYSQLSAFNSSSRTPPMVVKKGGVIAYLSKNKELKGAIDPLVLGIVCFDYEPE